MALWTVCFTVHSLFLCKDQRTVLIKPSSPLQLPNTGLVNNAARFIFHSVLTASDKDWNDSLSVNIKGHALVLKHIVPIMKRGTDERNIGGSSVNLASVSSVIAQPNCITYAATKAGYNVLYI